MEELKNIEYAFKMFDLKTKMLMYGLKEAENGKIFKRINKVQIDSDNDGSLRK